MYTKAADLKEFYDSVQGRVVQRVVRQHIRQIWPDVSRQRVAGFGYPLPYLRPLMPTAERVIALMPSQQGAVFWPRDDKGLVTLCEEGELPIETNSIDRLLVIHGMQGYESLDLILPECARVLTGQGSLILVVPNRTGLWARFDSTPFGSGVPYSMGQIRSVLKQYQFLPEKSVRALFVPPSSSRITLAMTPLWEKIGQRFFNAFGGLNIIEASKQLYAGTLVGAVNVNAARRRFQTSPRPLSRSSK